MFVCLFLKINLMFYLVSAPNGSAGSWKNQTAAENQLMELNDRSSVVGIWLLELSCMNSVAETQ